MIRSMFTAISSLNLHQKYLDVVSNNLANANTNGYKSSRVIFQDQFAQMLSSGAAPTTRSSPSSRGRPARSGAHCSGACWGRQQGSGRPTWSKRYRTNSVPIRNKSTT